MEGIVQPSGSKEYWWVHSVPGQQVTPVVPPQTPSAGASRHDVCLAAHLPAVQSRPAQQSVLAVQALPRAAQAGMALQTKALSLMEAHSLPAQQALVVAVQSWPSLKQAATHCPLAQ